MRARARTERGKVFTAQRSPPFVRNCVLLAAHFLIRPPHFSLLFSRRPPPGPPGSLPVLVSDPLGKDTALIHAVTAGPRVNLDGQPGDPTESLPAGASFAASAEFLSSEPTALHVGAPPGGKGVVHVAKTMHTTDWLLGLDSAAQDTVDRSMRVAVMCIG